MTVKVAINGYGTIGKRVADAVSLQKDMEVAGVVKTRPTFEARLANEKGLPLFANSRENEHGFREAGLKVEGTIDGLIESADIVVDCTPKPIGAGNKERIYIPRRIKAIYQGGEKASVAERSFNAYNNYEACLGKDHVRIVSCNTTGLARTLGAIRKSIPLDKVRVNLIRRGPDPWDDSSGPVNAIVPDPITIPSHHGPDVKTIIPDLDIVTAAVVVPTTIMHMHIVNARLAGSSSRERLLEIFEAAPRIITVSGSEGTTSTAKIMEMARDMGRSRSDLQEIAVWADSVAVLDGNEAFYMQAVHQESDVVPENIDCIRSMLELTRDGLESMKATDRSLGLKKWW